MKTNIQIFVFCFPKEKNINLYTFQKLHSSPTTPESNRTKFRLKQFPQKTILCLLDSYNILTNKNGNFTDKMKLNRGAMYQEIIYHGEQFDILEQFYLWLVESKMILKSWEDYCEAGLPLREI